MYFLFIGNVPGATLCATVGLLLTFLARFSQFKRFKGWGFEAEMWEEKQQEAEKLVESLKGIAALTAREVMLQSIKSGRWGSGKRWEDHWKLFEEVKAAQAGLLDEDGQRKVRRSIDRWFLHDMAITEFGKLKEIVTKEVEQARQEIRVKFGNPVSDPMAFEAEMQLLSTLDKSIGLFELAGTEPLIESIEKWWESARKTLANFGIDVAMPSEVRSRLDTYKALESLPEMPVTKELIAAGVSGTLCI
ncbi:hypothetical protein [Tabrizicola thermarum]|uniref:hypothetical protein n=1 Tax=Tabrizicola thermarum TaxID=2670345 RepID=UPI0012D79A40|nr:hypothetical protein [Tabrizicola thermarum]